MKTIVIRPEIIAYHNSAFREPKRPLNKAFVACAALLPVVAAAGWLLGHAGSQPPAVPVPVAATPALRVSQPVPPAPLVFSPDGAVELQTAVDKNLTKAQFTGNGRNQMTAEILNPGSKPLTVRVSFGQIFTSGKSTVVATRSAQTELAPGQCVTLPIAIAATRSANRVAPAKYQLSSKTAPKIDLLLTYVQDHPEIPVAALQTAVLALAENLPLSAVCKFASAGNDLPSRFDTSAFRVETPELIAALALLRQIGVRDGDLAMTVDPQLKIESMIDPVCRASAMRYYGITSAAEWNFWKSQLLEGDPGTRHYALYGIARFYPEIALQMLPTWAREKRTTQIFRLTAVQALAETQRPEALNVLSSLVLELGRNTELGRAALDSAQILNESLRKTSTSPHTVAFRGNIAAAPF